jgi:hypothetical protein
MWRVCGFEGANESGCAKHVFSMFSIQEQLTKLTTTAMSHPCRRKDLADC